MANILKQNSGKIQTYYLLTVEFLGLDDCVLPYMDRFTESKIDGRELLNMTTCDIQDIGIRNIGAQRTIIQALNLLCHLVRFCTIFI